jgi:hypothetical protein
VRAATAISLYSTRRMLSPRRYVLALGDFEQHTRWDSSRVQNKSRPTMAVPEPANQLCDPHHKTPEFRTLSTTGVACLRRLWPHGVVVSI